LETRDSSRVRIASFPGGLRVEIRPWIRSRGARLRLVLLAGATLAASLLGGSRLASVWETGLSRGRFEDLPIGLLLALTAAVGLSVPAAIVGLAALAFAEETIEVRPDAVEISTTAFERTRTRRIAQGELLCWRETYRPLSPWWTWAFRRLAAETPSALLPIAGAAGPREKREIALALARATGKPLVDGSGRAIGSAGADRIARSR
jgi:hypothetical protein